MIGFFSVSNFVLADLTRERTLFCRLDADGVGGVVENAALSADRLDRDVVVHASRAEQGKGI